MDSLFGEKLGAKTKRKTIDTSIFEALCLACSLDWKSFTKTERGKINSAAHELKMVGATPEEIRRRAEVYKLAFPHAVMTPKAISGQWSYLGFRIANLPESPAAICTRKGHTFESFTSYCTRCGRVPKPPDWKERT